MTKQEIYDTIVSLTTEIKTTGVGLELVNVSTSEEVAEIFNKFTHTQGILYLKIRHFGSKIKDLLKDDNADIEIFGFERDESKEIWVFDPNVIDSLSFFTLTFMAYIDHVPFFKSYISDGKEIVYCDNDVAILKALEKEIVYYDDSAYLESLAKDSGSHKLVSFLETFDCIMESSKFFSHLCLEDLTTDDLLVYVLSGKIEVYLE